MTVQRAARTAQYELSAEFIIDIANDAIKSDVNGAQTNFKAASCVFDAVALPPNAVVVGGDVTVETVSNDSGAATIAVGDSAVANRYLAATSTKAAARTALTLTGYRGVGENVRVTLANANGDATAGKVSLRVKYIVTGRANETQIA